MQASGHVGRTTRAAPRRTSSSSSQHGPQPEQHRGLGQGLVARPGCRPGSRRPCGASLPCTAPAGPRARRCRSPRRRPGRAGRRPAGASGRRRAVRRAEPVPGQELVQGQVCRSCQGHVSRLPPTLLAAACPGIGAGQRENRDCRIVVGGGSVLRSPAPRPPSRLSPSPGRRCRGTGRSWPASAGRGRCPAVARPARRRLGPAPYAVSVVDSGVAEQRLEESSLALTRRARRIHRTLAERYPDAHCELDFTTSAGAPRRDDPVRADAPTSGSTRSPRRCSPGIRTRRRLRRGRPDRAGDDRSSPTGFFRAKTDSPDQARRSARQRDFGGEVPRRLEQLVTLPGVGRKTANVVLGNAFGVPGITVDTHFGRLARRFGWTASGRPGQGRAGRRRAVPAQGLDDAVPPADLPRPADLPLPASRPAAPARWPRCARPTASARPTRSGRGAGPERHPASIGRGRGRRRRGGAVPAEPSVAPARGRRVPRDRQLRPVAGRLPGGVRARPGSTARRPGHRRRHGAPAQPVRSRRPATSGGRAVRLSVSSVRGSRPRVGRHAGPAADVLLTERAATLRSHAGQVAFPGGADRPARTPARRRRRCARPRRRPVSTRPGSRWPARCPISTCRSATSR